MMQLARIRSVISQILVVTSQLLKGVLCRSAVASQACNRIAFGNPNQMMKPLLVGGTTLVLGCVSAVAAGTNNLPNSRAEPFILGAEVSWVPEDEADGAEYFDHGVRKDIFRILHDHKFNYIRLRLFVDPTSTNGYARYRNEAFCGLEQVKALAKRAQAYGMGLLLDVHYGDTWTSPGRQAKPVAWQGMDFGQLTQAVHDFTHRAIYELRTNGTPAEMVQIGNEVSDGMLFPDGSRSSFDNFAALVEAGIAGAKEADPSVKIVLHHHLGRSNERMVAWIDNFIQRGTKFDIIGMSCYAQAKEGDWERNFADLAKRYPDKSLLVVEYSAQKRYINDLMLNTPNGKGLGTFIWEPTRHREALFDKDGKNAGGGQESNFTSDTGIVQGARLQTNSLSSGGVDTNSIKYINRRFANDEAARAAWRRQQFGGRYDANELFELYPQMAADYARKQSSAAIHAMQGADPVLPPKDKGLFHIYLLMGQSNMEGADVHGLDSQTDDPRILALNAEGQWVLAREPITSKSGGIGPGIPFAKGMLKDNPAVTIGLVPCAVGGSALNRWLKGAELYQKAVARAGVAARAGTICGVLWHQGESDTGRKGLAGSYEARLTKMFKDLRQDLGKPDLPIVVGQLGVFLKTNRFPYVESVRSAIEHASQVVPDIGYADSTGLNHMGDELHFSAEAQSAMGANYARAMQGLQKK